MHRLFVLSALLLLPALSTGCFFPEFGGGIAPGYGEQPNSLELEVTSGVLSGQIGQMTVLDSASADSILWADQWYTSIELHTRVNGRSAMGAIGIEGDIRTLLDSPGTHTFSWTDDIREEGLFVSFLGCSGPSQYNWDFDTSAETVTVEVTEEQPGVTTLRVLAPLDDGNGFSTPVTGEVTIDRGLTVPLNDGARQL